MAVLAVWLAGSSCGDPTSNLRSGPDRVTADPSSITLDQGESQDVIIRVLDEQGNELASTVTDVAINPAGLVNASIDSSFLAGTDTTGTSQIPEPTRTKLVVVGGSLAAGTITVTASGKQLVIPVRVIPVATEFAATFSNQVPAIGEQVTVTAPAGFTFTDTSVVTFTGVAPAINTAIGGNTLTFLPSPNSSGKATITNIVPSYAPTLSLDFTTVDTIGVTPRVDTLLATYSTTTPASSQPVTVTAPAGFRFQPTAAVSVAGIAAIINSRAVDSSSITFQVTPGTIGPVKIDSTLVMAAPQFPLSLPTRDSLVAAPLAPLAGTGSTGSAPNTNAPGLGLAAAIFDVGGFTANDIVGDCDASCPSKAQYYKLTITEAGDYTVSLDWDNADTDLDGFLCNDAACSAPQLLGSGGDHPEVTSFTALTPGTYYIDAVLFDNIGPVPGTVTITITHDVPAGP
jgi:hypothetical protein